MVRAGIYARISSDREGDNLAISRQLADCEALAARREWTVVERYVDSDISAYSGKRRPQYQRMLEEIDAGVVDAVVVYHADRLHRHPRELEDFIDLCQRTKTKLATVSGDLDLSTHEGQLLARITGAVARSESDAKSRRTIRKHEELAAAGKVSGGGSRPYGYEADKRTIRAEEAEVIRDCATRVLAGDSLRAICKGLNARGVLTVMGKQWSPHTLRRLLMSARISGQREHNGEIVAKAEWPAIITPRQTVQLRAKLGDPDRRTNRTARRYLLTRLLRCSHCGTQLYARPRADGSRRYVCASGPGFGGCGKVTVVADPVEAFVVEAVLHRLESPEGPFLARFNADGSPYRYWPPSSGIATNVVPLGGTLVTGCGRFTVAGDGDFVGAGHAVAWFRPSAQLDLRHALGSLPTGAIAASIVAAEDGSVLVASQHGTTTYISLFR